MAKRYYLLPNSTIAAVNWTRVAGGGASLPATVHQAIADTLPAAGTRASSGNPWTRIEAPGMTAGVARFTFDTFTLPSDVRIRSVNLLSYGQTNGASLRVQMGNGPQNLEDQGDVLHTVGHSHHQVLRGALMPLAMGATAGTFKEWEQADIDDLRLRLTAFNSLGLGAVANYDVKAEVWTVAKPIVRLSNIPSVLNEIGHRVRWFNNQPDPDTQKRFHVKIFREDQYGEDNFDPDTTPAIHSKNLASAANFYALPNILPWGPTFYRVYVRTAVDFNGQDYWSEWSETNEFKMNSAPTVTVTGPGATVTDTSRPEIQWTYTDPDGDTQSKYSVYVYEEPAGGVWPSSYPYRDDVPYNAEGTSVRQAYYSGIIESSATEHQLAYGLKNNTTYRAFVRIYQGFQNIGSNWSYVEFTTNFPEPVAPTLTIPLGPLNQPQVPITITPGTPVAGTKVMAAGYDGIRWVETPHNTGFNIPLDIDIRVRRSLIDWTPEEDVCIASKWGSTGRSWAVWVQTDGKLRFDYTQFGDEGSTKSFVSTVATGLAGGVDRWVRVQCDQGTPVGSTTVTFALSPDDVTYTTLGAAVVQTGTEGIYNSINTPIRLGVLDDSGSGVGSGAGHYYGFSLRPLIGAVVANPDLTAQPLGNAPFTDAAGRAWSFQGAAEIEYLANPTPDRYEVERSFDNGETWSFFRAVTDETDSIKRMSDEVPRTLRIKKAFHTTADFEDGTSGTWNPASASFTFNVDNAMKHRGQYSLKIVRPATTGNMQVFSATSTEPKVPVVAGEQVYSSIWVRHEYPGSRTMYLRHRHYAGNALVTDVNATAVPVPPNVWFQLTHETVMPATTDGLLIGVFSAQTFTAGVPMWVDDLELEGVASVLTIYDDEAPFRENVLYRGRAFSQGYDTELSSPYSASHYSSLDMNEVWIKSTVDSALAAHFFVQDRWMEKQRSRPRSAVRTIGRKKPVVIKSVADSLEFRLSLLIPGQEQKDLFDEIVASGHTVFVQTPKGSWWAEIGETVEEAASLWDGLHGEDDLYQLLVNFTEVDA